MIRINLLKNIGVRRKKQTRAFPVGMVVTVAGVLVVLGAIGTGVFFFLQQQKKPEEKVVPVVVDSTFAPSSHTSRTIVEDVVRDVQDTQLVLQETGLLSLPYADFSFEEKVNYEFLFAHNVFAMLGSTVPRSVGLQSLELDNFTTVRAYGVCPSRETVARVFADLRRHKATILPKPQSSIVNTTEGGFLFHVAMTVEYGLNLKDPMVDPSLAGLPSRQALAGEVEKLTRVFETNRVALKRPLAMVDGVKLEKFRRLSYAVEATCSYDDFVRAVGALYDQHIQCAFSRLQLIARSPGRVSIKATVVFTTKE